jgi:hypothetical protein
MNWDKAKNFLLIVLTAAFLTVFVYAGYLVKQLHEQSLVLTAKDAEVQQLDLDLGLAKSELLNSKDLEKNFQKEFSELDDRLKKLIKEHDLEIKSRDITIAKLNNKVSGTSVVKVDPVENVCRDGTCPPIENTKISYQWIDDKNRFMLEDPNIWTPDDEVFTSEQFFKVTGYVFEAKDGQLQTKNVQLQEVVQDGENWIPVSGSKVTLLDSKFQYTNRLVENSAPSLLDIITLRPYVSYDTALSPGVGFEIINLGRYFPGANLGIGPKASADVTDVLQGSLLQSRLGVDLIYHLAPPVLDTNLGIGVGVSSPVLTNTLLDAGTLGNLRFTLSMHFYLTDDLSPF